MSWNILAQSNASPISCLPAEILCSIFEENVDRVITSSVTGSETLPDSYYKPPIQVNISQVSRHWRNIAITCPILWRSIIVGPYRPSKLLPMYLERSAGCTIDLRFDNSLGWDENIESMVMANKESMVDLILPHVHRLRRLEIVLFEDSAVYSTLLRFKDIFAPSLEALVFYATGLFTVTRANLEAFPEQIFRGGAPRLRYLQMDGRRSSTVLPPLALLETMHFDSSSDPENPVEEWSKSAFRTLTTSSSRLTTLIFHRDLGAQVCQAYQPIVLPSVLSLDVSGLRLLELFKGISLPNLESLTLRKSYKRTVDFTSYAPDAPDSPYSPRFPHFSHLKTLAFIGEITAPNQFRQISQQTPHVRHLTMLMHSETMLQHFCFGMDSAEYWPDLCSIRVRETTTRERGVRSLVATVATMRPNIKEWKMDFFDVDILKKQIYVLDIARTLA